MIPGKRQWLSFASLVVVQTQNAFNDNAVKYMLLPLGTALVALAKQQGHQPNPFLKSYQYLIAALLILPYIVLSPICGWLADRYPRNRIISMAMCLQTVIFVLVAVSVHSGQLGWATLGFFLLAIQATFLSPSKNGIIRDLVGGERLHFANGWIEMTLILGILAGMFVGGKWFDSRLQGGHDPWWAAGQPLWILAAATLLPLVLSWFIEKVPARRPGAPFTARLLYGHFAEIGFLFKQGQLGLATIGVMVFWFIGVASTLIIVQVAEQQTGGLNGMGSALSVLTACASGGIAVGSVFVTLIGRRRPVLGLIPLGGLMLALACWGTGLVHSSGWILHLALGVIGAFSALFFVPVFAWFQEHSPTEDRGRLLAACNVLDNLAMVLATLVQMLMKKTGVPVGLQFAVLGCVALAGAVLSLPLMTAAFWKGLISPLMRWFYRIETRGLSNLPAHGGALVVCNHVSYVDAFILSVTCPRPLRFVIFEDYYKPWWAKWFLDRFLAIPIRPEKAKEAIRRTAAALADGDLVCIFPEGKLTTDGRIQSFQRGLEVILRLTPAPLVPAALHGLWGSFFSWFGGKPFSRFPRRLPVPVRLAVGSALPATTTAAEAEAAVRDLAAQAEGA